MGSCICEGMSRRKSQHKRYRLGRDEDNLKKAGILDFWRYGLGESAIFGRHGVEEVKAEQDSFYF